MFVFEIYPKRSMSIKVAGRKKAKWEQKERWKEM